MRKVMLTATAILIAATAAQAQNPDEIAQRQIAEYKGMAERQAATEFKVAMAERVPLEKTIKGAPYAAEIVTETNQTLADGNRISRRTTGRVYRDNEGRVRREEDRRNGTVAITIVDGVAGVSYRLEPDTRIAWKTSSATTAALMKEIEEKRLEERRQRERERVGGEPARTAPSPPPPAPGAVLRTSPNAPPPPPPAPGDERNAGPLERKTLEWIAVEGRRNTSTIPAGQIGNEQPITVISEEWRSPELNVLVMTHHIDPRLGESSYRLTNIVRGEPDPSLFQVPAGFTVKETGIRREFQKEQ
jgi:hypothetical protein